MRQRGRRALWTPSLRLDSLEPRALLSVIAHLDVDDVRPRPTEVSLHPTKATAMHGVAATKLRSLPVATSGLTAHDLRRVARPMHGPAPLASGAAAPYTPQQIYQAYGFNQIPNNGSGITIAIVDAYNDPKIKSDLATFDSTFGLAAPPSFSVVNQSGGSKLPRANSSWSVEISLDVEWAHAIAPKANIILVEASTPSFTNLLAAEDYARNHAQVVSNSWGSSEFSGETSYDSHFTSPTGKNVAFTVASGDSGSPAGYPGVAPGVLATGGTTLPLDASGNLIAPETGWSGSGGGVSAYEPVPSYQVGLGYSGRTNPDVSYNADPNTGYYVLDSYSGGWYAVGGTSAAAPQWAGLIALADQNRSTPLNGTTLLNLIYGLKGQYFNDVTAGSNGGYTAAPGYDLVTGWGSPQAQNLVPYLSTH
ncbi:MAG: S53 family peptidase [Planctomycetota bacterium]|nr:S53 family peptidase [Planctomycetota bacterium]